MNDAHKFIISSVYYDRYLNLINIFDCLHVKSLLALHWIQHKKDTDSICVILVAISVYAEWRELNACDGILFEKDVVIIS